MEPIKIHRTRKLSEAALASLAALTGQRMIRLVFDTVYANCTTEKQGIEMYGQGEFRIAVGKIRMGPPANYQLWFDDKAKWDYINTAINEDNGEKLYQAHRIA